MKTVKEINKEWGDKFVSSFNMQDAAIVFAIALTKDNKVKICATTDVPPEKLKEILKGVINNLGG